MQWSDVRDDAIGIVFVRVSRDGKRVIADFSGKSLDVECEYDGETFKLVRQWVPKDRVHMHTEVQMNTEDWYWDHRSRSLENTVDGRSPTLGKNERILKAQISTNHAVSVATVVKVVGEFVSLDIYGHYTNYRVVAFDAETGRVLMTVPFNGKENKPYCVELSPDGGWMMLLNGRELSVYKVRLRSTPGACVRKVTRVLHSI